MCMHVDFPCLRSGISALTIVSCCLFDPCGMAMCLKRNFVPAAASLQLLSAAMQDLGQQTETEALMVAAVHAATLLRKAQKQAYAQKHRSMVASDVMHALADVVDDSWPR
jgi:hypothetical protein